MLDYSSITSGKYITVDGEPYEVLSSHIFRKQQRKPVNQTKLKNLKTGKVTERSFHQSEKAEEADIETASITFIFSKQRELWFHSTGDKSDRFSVPERSAGNARGFLSEGMEIEALIYNEAIIGLKPPIKVDLTVTEAPPAVRGNTAQGGDKVVTVETGATVTVPIFINEGDVIRINTDTGQYTERVEKR